MSNKFNMIKYVAITVDKFGYYITHSINEYTEEELQEHLGKEVDLMELPFGESNITLSKEYIKEKIKSGTIPDVGKMMGIVVNAIHSVPIQIPLAAMLLSGKGGVVYNLTGSPKFPKNLTILEVVVDLTHPTRTIGRLSEALDPRCKNIAHEPCTKRPGIGPVYKK